MRNPETMRFKTSNRMMRTGKMVGSNRPVGRVTLAKNVMKRHASDTTYGPWASLLYDQPDELEIFGVKSIEINRELSQDAATCTITFYNDDMNPGWEPEGTDEGIGRPGYLTPYRGDIQNPPPEAWEPADNWFLLRRFGRNTELYRSLFADGDEDFATGFDYPYNSPIPGTDYTAEYMKRRLIPNRVMRTYQGYGSDNFDAVNGEMRWVTDLGYVKPQSDDQLEMTGVWLIDRVSFGTDGMITVECRDLFKLLLEQHIFPDAIPIERFPLVYGPVERETVETGEFISVNAADALSDSSNTPWVGFHGSVYGHTAAMAFDNLGDTWWLSVGNSGPNQPWSYEWIEALTGGHEINEVEFTTVGTQYVVFVSVFEDGAWQGTDTVPYDPNSPPAAPNGADIPYVMRVTMGTRERPKTDELGTGLGMTIRLPRTYRADKVRLTFTNLHYFKFGQTAQANPYRAAVKEIICRNVIPETRQINNSGDPGIITEWNIVIKELLGWAGFIRIEVPGLTLLPDPLFGREVGTGKAMRIHGDIELTRAGPIWPTPPDWFMNKSFMEACNQVADMLGHILMCGEAGEAVFRLPNFWSPGNWIDQKDDTPNLYPSYEYDRDEFPIEFHEDANLVNYSVTIDDSQLRSSILCIGGFPPDGEQATGEGAVMGGTVLSTSGEDSNAVPIFDFTEELGGQNRLFIIPSEASKGFLTPQECQRMAELTSLFVMFTYRKGQLKSPAHPGLQLDDQVRIFERMTDEASVHYVSGIRTHQDMETGEYSMDVTTHWLGDRPTSRWFLNHVQLTEAVKTWPAVLERIGAI